MSNITFVLFTYNEEKRIGYAIRNFIKYGNILIMDGGSTDKTKEIAESMGASFYLRPISNKRQVSTTKNLDFIKSKIKTDWIYWGYVDNMAPKSLAEKLVEISFQDKFKMVLMPLYTYLWGDTKIIAHKEYTPFFFHKDYMDFSGNQIHGMGKFTGRNYQKLKLPDRQEFALKHFNLYNINKFVNNYLQYAEGEAIEKQQSGIKFSSIRMLVSMIRYVWIYRRSLRSGALGLIIVFSFSFSRLMTYARLYELGNNITLDSIEKNYSIAKEKMLEEFK